MATITAPVGRRRTAPDASVLAHLDVALLALPIAISALGLLMIFDASRHETALGGLTRLYYVERQSAAIVIGLVAMAVTMAIDYRRIRDAWPLVYLAILPLLAGVVVLGRNHNGAQAWFQIGPFQFQPSELAKVVLVVAIAGYCHQHRGDLDAWRVAVAVGLAGLVMAVVYAQHDLGTMLVIMVCAAAVLVIAGLKPALIVAIASALVVAVFRLIRRQTVRHALNGLFGVGIGGYLAWHTGSAKAFYLPGIIISFAYGVVMLASVLVRRPLVGWIWSLLVAGGSMAWRDQPSMVRLFSRLTVLWSVTYLAKVAIQTWLYQTMDATVLGVARLVLGYPPYALLLAMTVWAVRRHNADPALAEAR